MPVHIAFLNGIVAGIRIVRCPQTKTALVYFPAFLVVVEKFAIDSQHRKGGKYHLILHIFSGMVSNVQPERMIAGNGLCQIPEGFVRSKGKPVSGTDDFQTAQQIFCFGIRPDILGDVNGGSLHIYRSPLAVVQQVIAVILVHIFLQPGIFLSGQDFNLQTTLLLVHHKQDHGRHKQQQQGKKKRKSAQISAI